MAFDGRAPERTNGRLAMLGFVAAMAAELATGKSCHSSVKSFVILGQIADLTRCIVRLSILHAIMPGHTTQTLLLRMCACRKGATSCSVLLHRSATFERCTGKGVLSQWAQEPTLVFLTFVLFIAASLAPLFNNADEGQKLGPFTPTAELINGRAAM